jgi:hypothetical protein
MAAALRLDQKAAVAVVALVAVASAGFLLACASSGGEQERAPGMYGLTGWNGWTSDINGEVGHRLYVSGPTAGTGS